MGRVLAAIIALACAASADAQPSPDGLWGDLPLPGGAAAARAALNLGDPEHRLESTVLVDLVRRYANTDLRAAALRLEAHLAAQTAAAEAAPATSLPLPLPAFWQDTFGSRNVPLVVSMLRNRGALLTYHGLMGLDPATLRALATRPALLRELAGHGTASAAFAMFAQSLRLGPDGVSTPGGPGDAALWQMLVGAPPSDVDAFVRALFTGDNGRLAWFYDTVADLPAHTQRFVLATGRPDEERLTAVRPIYSRFASVDPNWRIDTRPFYRPSFDAALALLVLDPPEDGRLGPDWWPSVFEEATRQADWSTPRPAPPADADRPADARWMFDWVFAVPDQARQRFAALRFAQRVFADASRDAAPHMVAALGGVIELPSLMFTLERLGLRDAETLAAAARAARAATHAGNPSRVLPALGRWQAALGLLEQVQRRAALPEARVAALVQSLSAIAPADPDGAAGSVAAWIHDELLPAVVPAGTSTVALEDAFLQGATTPRARRERVFTWEGLPYIVDEPAVALRSAVAIRRARVGPQLQDLVELHEVRQAVTRADRLAPAQVRSIVVRLERLAPTIAQVDHRDDRRVRDFARMIQSIGGTLGDGLARQLPTITAALDVITETVVPALLYALAVSPTTEPVLYPDAWTRHGLDQPPNLPAGSGRPWREVAWQFPVDYGFGGGTRLTGAFLAVDVALAASQLVRPATTTLPVPGVIDEPMRRGLVERLVLAGSTAPPDVAPTLLADLAAARSAVASWRGVPPPADELRATLRAAWTDPWRANALTWEASRNHEAVLAQLAMSELAAIGMNAGGHPGLPGRWSGSSRLIDGCLCLTEARPVTPEQVRGRRIGIQALRPLDITIRLAELLAELELDPALIPALMPMALQDWIDRAQPGWPDDWDAFTVWPRALPLERVEEYLLHLVSTGVFSPPAPEEVSR